MSSSTPARDTSPAAAAAAAPSAAGFRRWSRNLSAQRQRELHRLNQIERGRQFLELRSQNDLFAQMSAAQVAQVVQVSGEKPPLDDQQLANQDEQARRSTTPVGGARFIWTPSPTDEDKPAATGTISPEPSVAPELVSRAPDDTTSSRSTVQQATELAGKRPMLSGEQVRRFVSLPVPPNRRVLCLIVRDKLSRLTSRARSYFYPTYYLFVQAIVELDEATGLEVMHSTGAKPVSSPTALTSSKGGGGEATDNSFSASSSISADMLFIGDLSAAGNKLSTGEGAAAAAVEAAVAGSYSDNERLAGDETEPDEEDDGRSSLVFPNGRLPGPSDKIGQMKDPMLPRHPTIQATTIGNTDEEDGDADSDNDESAAAAAAATHNWKAAAAAVDDDDDEDDDYLSEPTGQTGYYLRPAALTVGGQVRATASVADEEVDDGSRYDIEEENLFNNERNPFTGTYGVLLAGRRRKKAKTYLIGPNEYGYTRRNSICKLKSNVLGTQFNAISLADNDRCTIASISYETNVLGFKGPRKMRVFLAKDLAGGTKNLPETFKKNPTAVVQLRNMTPSWNVESQSYVLNFHGRVTQASVKNFQLIECDDHLPEGQRYQSTVFGSAAAGSSNGSKSSSTGNKELANNQQAQVQKEAIKTSNQRTGDQQQTNRSDLSTSNGHRANNSRKDANGTTNDFSGRVVKSSSSLLLNNGSSNANANIPFETQPPPPTESRQPSSGNKSHLTYNSSIVMQFGRISTHEFTCDVAHPLSILQAFSIALSSFDSKLACE